VGAKQIGDQTWDVALFELKKVIGLVVACGMIRGCNLRVKILWGKSWGYAMFSHAIPSNIIFLDLMRYLLFDLKMERCRNILHDKVDLFSQLRDNFIENLQKVFFL